MAWEWSHTAEGLEHARANVHGLSKRELLVILGEWNYHDRETAHAEGEARADLEEIPEGEIPPAPTLADFTVAPAIRKLDKDTIAGIVWDRMEELRTCTNGGWEAYACPDGCHTVPFDLTAAGRRALAGWAA